MMNIIKQSIDIEIEKIAVLGDPHLTTTLPYTFSGNDSRESALIYYIGFFLSNLDPEKTILIIPGDLCHRSFQSPSDLALLIEVLVMIRNHGINTVISNGNHDLDGSESILKFLSYFSRTHKNIFYFDRSIAWDLETDNASFRVVNFCEDSNFLVSAKVRPVEKNKKILIGHVGIRHTLHGSTKSIHGVKPEDIESLEKIYDLMIFGHHHYYQKVGNKGLYPGSIQQTRIDERKQVPGGIIIDVQMRKVNKVPNRYSPRFILVENYKIFPKMIRDNIVKPILDLENKTEKENLEFLERIKKHEPYYLIRPKTKKVHSLGEASHFKGGKKKALVEVLRKSKVKKKKAYARHTVKIYEEARKEIS